MPTGYEMSPKLLAAVERESEDKDVQWVGCPNPQVVLLRNFGIWLFAVPWTVFTLSIAFASRSQPASISIHLLFLVIGIGMLASPFTKALRARSTAHIVTSECLITVAFSMLGRLQTKTVQLSSIQSIERDERSDGFGTLTLHTGWTDSDGDRVKVNDVLYGIPEVRAVEALIVRLRDKPPGTK